MLPPPALSVVVVAWKESKVPAQGRDKKVD